MKPEFVLPSPGGGGGYGQRFNNGGCKPQMYNNGNGQGSYYSEQNYGNHGGGGYRGGKGLRGGSYGGATYGNRLNESSYGCKNNNNWQKRGHGGYYQNNYRNDSYYHGYNDKGYNRNDNYGYRNNGYKSNNRDNNSWQSQGYENTDTCSSGYGSTSSLYAEIPPPSVTDESIDSSKAELSCAEGLGDDELTAAFSVAAAEFLAEESSKEELGGVSDGDESLAGAAAASCEKSFISDHNEDLPAPDQILYPSSKLKLTWRTDRRRSGVGLVNIGNTCYINSVLQCLSHCPPLVNYLMYGLQHSACERQQSSVQCLLCVMRSHVCKCFNDRYSFEPYSFVNRLKEISKDLTRGFQEDAHEFLRQLLDKFQQVCLRFHETSGGTKPIERYSRETTVISQIFSGYLRSQICCKSCHYRSNTYESFLDICLDIKEVSSIYGALTDFFKKEVLADDNAYNCSNCKKKVLAVKSYNIHLAPNVLTLQLKRYSAFTEDKKKVSHHVDFPTTLNISPYLSSAGPHGDEIPNRGREAVDSRYQYSLCGVLTHSGNSLDSGHYWCYVRNPQGSWEQKNDHESFPVKLDKVLMAQAYLLFYTRVQSGQSVPPATLTHYIQARESFTEVQHGKKYFYNGKTIVHKAVKVEKPKQQTFQKISPVKPSIVKVKANLTGASKPAAASSSLGKAPSDPTVWERLGARPKTCSLGSNGSLTGSTSTTTDSNKKPIKVAFTFKPRTLSTPSHASSSASGGSRPSSASGGSGLSKGPSSASGGPSQSSFTPSSIKLVPYGDDTEQETPVKHSSEAESCVAQAESPVKNSSEAESPVKLSSEAESPVKSLSKTEPFTSSAQSGSFTRSGSLSPVRKRARLDSFSPDVDRCLNRKKRSSSVSRVEELPTAGLFPTLENPINGEDFEKENLHNGEGFENGKSINGECFGNESPILGEYLGNTVNGEISGEENPTDVNIYDSVLYMDESECDSEEELYNYFRDMNYDGEGNIGLHWSPSPHGISSDVVNSGEYCSDGGMYQNGVNNGESGDYCNGGDNGGYLNGDMTNGDSVENGGTSNVGKAGELEGEEVKLEEEDRSGASMEKAKRNLFSFAEKFVRKASGLRSKMDCRREDGDRTVVKDCSVQGGDLNVNSKNLDASVGSSDAIDCNSAGCESFNHKSVDSKTVSRESINCESVDSRTVESINCELDNGPISSDAVVDAARVQADKSNIVEASKCNNIQMKDDSSSNNALNEKQEISKKVSKQGRDDVRDVPDEEAELKKRGRKRSRRVTRERTGSRTSEEGSGRADRRDRSPNVSRSRTHHRDHARRSSRSTSYRKRSHSHRKHSSSYRRRNSSHHRRSHNRRSHSRRRSPSCRRNPSYNRSKSHKRSRVCRKRSSSYRYSPARRRRSSSYRRRSPSHRRSSSYRRSSVNRRRSSHSKRSSVSRSLSRGRSHSRRRSPSTRKERRYRKPSRDMSRHSRSSSRHHSRHGSTGRYHGNDKTHRRHSDRKHHRDESSSRDSRSRRHGNKLTDRTSKKRRRNKSRSSSNVLQRKRCRSSSSSSSSSGGSSVDTRKRRR